MKHILPVQKIERAITNEEIRKKMDVEDEIDRIFERELKKLAAAKDLIIAEKELALEAERQKAEAERQKAEVERQKAEALLKELEELRKQIKK
jgi:hypothetical protein